MLFASLVLLCKKDICHVSGQDLYIVSSQDIRIVSNQDICFASHLNRSIIAANSIRVSLPCADKKTYPKFSVVRDRGMGIGNWGFQIGDYQPEIGYWGLGTDLIMGVGDWALGIVDATLFVH